MRTLPILLATGLLAFGTAAVTASPAQAANLDCGARAPDIDHGSYHTAVIGAVSERTGPHSYCAQNDFVYSAERLDYYCYTRNDAGNTWTLLRDVETNTVGWIYDGNLSDGGSFYVCQGGNP